MPSWGWVRQARRACLLRKGKPWIKPVSMRSRLDGKEIGIQGIKEDMKSRIRVHDECEEMVLEKKKKERKAQQG